MKLYVLSDVPCDTAARICRQGRLMSAASTLIISLMLIGPPVFSWAAGMPWIVWGVCALLALLIVPLILGDMLARLSPTNWLLSVRPDGIWINFRSYQETGATDDRTVVHVRYDEIAAARRHVETFTTPSGDSGDSVRYTLECLDLLLTHGQTDDLQAALVANRNRQPSEQVYLGGIRVTTRASHFPVSLAATNIVRVAWRGGIGNWVVPSLRRVLKELEPRVCVTEANRHDRGDWQQLSETELDEQILQLVESGARIEAIRLLVGRRGYTTTEAHRFVDELACRA